MPGPPHGELIRVARRSHYRSSLPGHRSDARRGRRERRHLLRCPFHRRSGLGRRAVSKGLWTKVSETRSLVGAVRAHSVSAIERHHVFDRASVAVRIAVDGRSQTRDGRDSRTSRVIRSATVRYRAITAFANSRSRPA